MLDLAIEQRQLAKIVHDYAYQFPLTESDDAELLQGCYGYYIEAFNQVMDSTSKVQMDYICQQYPRGIIALQNGWSDSHRGLLMVLLKSLKRGLTQKTLLNVCCRSTERQTSH